MTRDQFIRKWRFHVGGMALYGLVSEVRDSTLKRASNAMDIPDAVDNLLGRLFDDASETKPPAAVAGGLPSQAKASKT